MKKKSNIIILVVVLVVVALIVWRLANNKKTINEKSQTAATINTDSIAIPVKTDTVHNQMMDMSITKTGSIVPFRESKVVATGSGTITRLNFNLGSRVAQGQILAVLDNRTNALQVQNAQNNATKLKGDLQTYEELLAGKATTAQKVKDLQQQYNEAVNQVAQLQKQAGDANIKAPISGVISSKDVEAGLYASPGMQIATIVELGQGKVQVNLSESEVYRLKQGQAVKITADIYPNHAFTGRVSFISPQADEARNYLVEIALSNNSREFELRSGTFVNVDFEASTSEQVITAPSQAITGSGENATVFIVQNSRAYQRKIKTGRTLQDRVEITGGLQPGDIIIVSGQINVQEGTLVKVSR